LKSFAASRRGQLEPAIESLRRVVVLYPEDLDFRESLGQTLAAAGREEAAQVELDEAARLRSGGTVDPSLGPFVGSREFPGKLVWVKVLPDGKVSSAAWHRRPGIQVGRRLTLGSRRSRRTSLGEVGT
jgi:hypothetical protein